MKQALLVFTALLLATVLPRYECRPVENPGSEQATVSYPQSDLQRQSHPILLRLGEEYFFRLGSANQNSQVFLRRDAPPTTIKRALQLQLTQRLLQGKVGNIRRHVSSSADLLDDPMEREKRTEDSPISLDLTFHLLREVLEMARAEKLAQQAHSNRKMMDVFGK